MKKFYVILFLLSFVIGSNAQCVIDTSFLPSPQGGLYPSAAHLPHIVRDSAYDQTIQVRIPDTMRMDFGGFISVALRVDSIRLDSVLGLPSGITWAKNPDVLRGGGFGCGRFSGTTSDTPGTYRIQPIGMAWAHLSVPLLGIDVDTNQYGRLDRLPGFGNYYVVIDSAQMPLAVTGTVVNLCDTTPAGSITAYATGGSPLAPYTYAWNTGATSYRINNLPAGSYSLTVTSGAETVSSTFTIMTDPPMVLTGSSDSSVNGNDGVAYISATGGTPPYRYFWQGQFGVNSDTLSGLAPGTYNVTVRDSFNCAAQSSVTVTGVSGILNLGNVTAQMNLFPIPANNSLNVVLNSSGNFEGKIEALDLTGKLVYSAPVSVTAGRFSKQISTEQFSQGAYVLRITSQNRSAQQLFTVSH